MLTQASLKRHLSYDQESGEFRWLSKGRGRWVGKIAGCLSDSGGGKTYLKIRIERTLYFSHRLAWLWVNGTWPVSQIDHKDGDGTNNKISNLRESDQGHNLGNRGIPHGLNPFKGITRSGKKWVAQIRYCGEHHYLGIFVSPTHAAEAYDKAALKYYKEFARTNKAMGLLP